MENFEKKLEEPSQVDDELVKTALSYEMIMQLTINHYKQLQEAKREIDRLTTVVDNLEKKSNFGESTEIRRNTYQSGESGARTRNGKVIPDVNTSDEGDVYLTPGSIGERGGGGFIKKKKMQQPPKAVESYNQPRIVNDEADQRSSLISGNSVHTEFERLPDYD
jgi:hypothetical protein